MPERWAAGVEVLGLGLTAEDPMDAVERRQRRRDRLRIGRLAVVDIGDAIDRADALHAVRQALEALQPGVDRRFRYAERLACGDRGERVLRIVRALQRRPARLIHAHAG